MKVCQPNVVIYDISDDEIDEFKKLLSFIGCHFNEFNVSGDKRIEVFKPEFI